MPLVKGSDALANGAQTIPSQAFKAARNAVASAPVLSRAIA